MSRHTVNLTTREAGLLVAGLRHRIKAHRRAIRHNLDAERTDAAARDEALVAEYGTLLDRLAALDGVYATDPKRTP